MQEEHIPIGRYRHETVVVGDFIVMVGGGTAHGVFDINNVYFFDTRSHTWRKKVVHKESNSGPISRKCHSVNKIGKDIYVFGGQGR